MVQCFEGTVLTSSRSPYCSGANSSKCASFLCSVLVVSVSTSDFENNSSWETDLQSGFMSVWSNVTNVMYSSYNWGPRLLRHTHTVGKNKPSSLRRFFTLCTTTDFTPNNTNKTLNEIIPHVCQLQGVNKIIYRMDWMNYKGNHILRYLDLQVV